MLEETCGVMEKKLPSRHSPIPSKTNFVCEKKCDFSPNKNVRQRKSAHGNCGWKTHDPLATRATFNQKFNRPYGDKRTRQRGSFGSRQSEEIADPIGDDDVFEPKSRKGGNVNHLLGFYFGGNTGHYGGYRVGGYRRGHHKPVKRYNKEQFLQASCQFVVRDSGIYKEQTICPDALVSWDMVELVRSFSAEEVNCAICRHSLYAGKITKCGHIYCWACMLRYLSLGEKDFRKCPICYDSVKADDLKSVQVVSVKDYKVGDEIEMTLMQRSKGSNFVLPKHQWKDRKGVHMNMHEGPCTKFGKLLLASVDQIRTEVIEREKMELDVLMAEAEQDEVCFIEMALESLNKKDAALEETFKIMPQRSEGPKIPGLHIEEEQAAPEGFYRQEKQVVPEGFHWQEKQVVPEGFHRQEKQVAPEGIHQQEDMLPNYPCLESPKKFYSDAFEDQMVELDSASTSSRPSLTSASSLEESLACVEIPSAVPEEASLPGCLSIGSPPSPFPVSQEQTVTTSGLTIAEASEELEHPDPVHHAQGKASDAFLDTTFFYQESSGQHIYINSLNAKCLSLEYRGLQNAPDKITASIVAIERLFMTEEIRKRFRYLNHIPLTCEFHVVELKIRPPLVSKEILQKYKSKFDARATKRREKIKDEKTRAKKHEVEQRKTYGIYPDVQIPLDNIYQFPCPEGLAPQPPAHGLPRKSLDFTDLENNSDPTLETCIESQADTVGNGTGAATPKTDSSTENESKSRSFAQMLQTGKPIQQTKAWSQISSPNSSTMISSSSVSTLRSPKATKNEDSDGEVPVPSYATSVCAGLDELFLNEKLQYLSTAGAAAANSPAKNGGKKKKKERQVLFSTSMARKN